jgi:transcriptional regulator with XRE-family HTH domain
MTNEADRRHKQYAKWHRRKTEEEKEIDREIGQRIKHVREKLAGPDDDLRGFAAKLGVTATAVYQWEHGSGITHYKLRKIAEVYNISVEWLLGIAGRPQRSLENQMKMLSRKVQQQGYGLFDRWLKRRLEDKKRQRQRARKQKDSQNRPSRSDLSPFGL